MYGNENNLTEASCRVSSHWIGYFLKEKKQNVNEIDNIYLYLRIIYYYL